MTRLWLSLLCCAATPGFVSDLSAATALVRCHPARGPVASVICSSPEYVAIDREIAALNDRATVELSRGDRRRLAETELRYYHQRQGCAWAGHNSAHPGAAVDECVRAAMEGRVRALRRLVDRGAF